MTLSLNSGQEAASEGFFAFLLGPDKELVITGPGGVGKTFTIGHMIDTILPRYFDTCKLLGIEPEYETVDMTATTNKAAEVLSYSTGRPVSTIHSLLNLKVYDDWSTGKTKLTKSRTWKVHEKKIIFVDECSMIDSDLYNILQEGTHKCKIVYVGDHCQLAPVMEKLSPVFMKGFNTYQLLEPMRTQDPDLQAINQQLRDTVETGEFKPIHLVPGKIELLDDTQMQQHIDTVFKDNNPDSRILAYTNKRVIAFNDHIRILRQLPDEYGVGETLVNNTGIQLRQGMLSVEAEVEIINQAHDTSMIYVDDGVELEVRYATLKTHIGQVFDQVPLPVNRQHHRDLLAYYKRKQAWNRYYPLKEYPDLRMRDASTVYKAQGSTYDSVYIDLSDISSCTHADQVARMLYVAFSRARHKVYLYGKLAEKYGGIAL